jgi:NADP-dependent 3-hydroxy acid dehydrogenase YdfG
MGRTDAKVVVVTGAAGGQGAHGAKSLSDAVLGHAAIPTGEE